MVYSGLQFGGIHSPIVGEGMETGVGAGVAGHTGCAVGKQRAMNASTQLPLCSILDHPSPWNGPTYI